jgi:glycosyltransferase involved in cell wall biosynthesis
MRIYMACPAPPRSLKGNRVTAARWAGLLRELGHRLTIAQDYDGTPCDALIALHARKSYPAVAAYRRRYPQGPLIVVLTGTDLYRDIRKSKWAQQSLELADRLVLLQPCGIDELANQLHGKARVIFQSAKPVVVQRSRYRRYFEVVVLGHLRHEKDPFRTALALRLLPENDQLRAAATAHLLHPAEISRPRARRLLARADLLVHSSRLEGGANVISEAIANGVPILASRIPGNVGLLGSGYPGYFPVGDTTALARLMARARLDAAFYARLRDWCAKLKPQVDPARERAAWHDLLDELTPP